MNGRHAIDIQRRAADLWPNTPFKSICFELGITSSTLARWRVKFGWPSKKRFDNICPRCKTTPRVPGRGWCTKCGNAYELARKHAGKRDRGIK